MEPGLGHFWGWCTEDSNRSSKCRAWYWSLSTGESTGQDCHKEKPEETHEKDAMLKEPASEMRPLYGRDWNGNRGSSVNKIYHVHIRSQSSTRQITREDIYLSFHLSCFNYRKHISNQRELKSCLLQSCNIWMQILRSRSRTLRKKAWSPKNWCIALCRDLVYTHSFTGLTQCAILIGSAYKKLNAKQTTLLFKVNLIPAYFKQIRNRLNISFAEPLHTVLQFESGNTHAENPQARQILSSSFGTGQMFTC